MEADDANPEKTNTTYQKTSTEDDAIRVNQSSLDFSLPYNALPEIHKKNLGYQQESEVANY